MFIKNQLFSKGHPAKAEAGESLPWNSPGGRMVARGYVPPGEEFHSGGDRQVVRLIIPFTGTPELLQSTPETHGLNFPFGEVDGNVIQFDVAFWGHGDEVQRIKGDIQRNCEMLKEFAERINAQVKRFNESLPGEMKAAFNAKLDELTSQHAMFHAMGIAEEPEPAAVVMAEPKAHKGPRKNASA